MSVIADLVGLARGRYGPGVPATPKPGANAPAPWLKPPIMGGSAAADALTAAASPATDDLASPPVEKDADLSAAPTPTAPPDVGRSSEPAEVPRSPHAAVPPRRGSAMTGAPEPSDALPGVGSSVAGPTGEPPAPPHPSRPEALLQPMPRERRMRDAAAAYRLRWPSRPADEAAPSPAPAARTAAEDASADRARPRAAHPAEETPPTQLSPSRVEPVTGEDRADRRTPAADDFAAVRLPVRITIGRIDIQVTGAETASPDRVRSALSGASRLRRAGVRRL